ncbi:hypothetical protein JR065_05410 [Xanthomonas sp. AmX2]|uniref:hypothetical protein n=1 Tax=Xanthomonas sp. TaxID=29446 RepID=UPI001980E7A8|nr:hypothetical protein [Xanthomonas sp.]MBN6149767.1 hypothetical protein [Xanthomonas sp.]
MRRPVVARSRWLLCAAVVALPCAASAAGQAPAALADDTLYRLGQADGTQLAQARYCDLPRTEVARLASALQHAARERALAANAAFDAAEHSAAMKSGFDDFRRLIALVDAQGDAQDPAQRQARYREQCAEVRAGVEALIGPLPEEEAKD